MFKLKLLVLFVIFFGVSLYSNGQKSKSHILTQDEAKIVKKDASTLFTTTDYRGALDAYIELYKVDSQNLEYNYRLGYCYLVTNVNKKASLKHLEFAIQSKDKKNEWFFYLGLAYMYNDKWDEALNSFAEYKKAGNLKPIKDFLPVDRLIEMCNNGKELSSHPINCKFTNLGKNINTSFDEFNPFISADQKTILFTSRRKGNAGGFIEDLGMYTADIYSASWRDTLWAKARSIGANVNTNWDEETVGISPAGDRLVVYFDNEDAFGDIGVSTLKGKMWQKPVMMSAEINSKEEENSACISQDGSIIIFSSNRKEGLGGRDLWMSKKEDGNYGKAVNLGSNINTSYDEKNPYLSIDGKRLYFCSKGWNSMGDYDIFCSRWSESENKWSKPENLGYPINNADENTTISFTADERFAYVAASGQPGLGERDIYQIEFLDTLHHPFAHFISINASAASGKTELKKISLTNNKTGSNTEITPSGSNVVLTSPPGEYTLSIEALNCKTYSDTTTVGDEFPPLPVIKKIVLESSK